MQITASGEPVCSFSSPNGKQPFEQIILACKSSRNCDRLKVLNGKIIVSVPSALHSHKPPLEGIRFVLIGHLSCVLSFRRTTKTVFT